MLDVCMLLMIYEFVAVGIMVASALLILGIYMLCCFTFGFLTGIRSRLKPTNRKKCCQRGQCNGAYHGEEE